MHVYDVVFIVKVIYALFILGYFSILDLKYRDIPDRYIWFSLGISVILLLVSIPYYRVYAGRLHPVILWSSILVEALILSMLVLLYYYKYIGGADVIVISELTLLFPLHDFYNYIVFRENCVFHVPPVIAVLVYSTLSLVLLLPVKALIVYVKYRRFIPRNISFLSKLVLLFTGTAVPVEKYLSMKHYYPLTILEYRDGEIVERIRSSFSIDEDYWRHQERIKELLDKGLVDPGKIIWVTYGIPFIVPLLFGYIFALIFGDYLFLLTIGSC